MASDCYFSVFATSKALHLWHICHDRCRNLEVLRVLGLAVEDQEEGEQLPSGAAGPVQGAVPGTLHAQHTTATQRRSTVCSSIKSKLKLSGLQNKTGNYKLRNPSWAEIRKHIVVSHFVLATWV
jgi:hypothetical protein